MSRDNGEVLGSTRIFNSGSNASRFNLVLLAEGYTEDQQDLFNEHCEQFVAALQDDKWLRGMAAAFNIHRINVASDEEGTDDPDSCDGGDAAAVDTFFDSSLCTGFPVAIRRLMHFDSGLAAEVCDQEVPEWDAAIVLVNTDQFGGAGGGRIGITVTNGDWTSILLHELGHTAFGLADEYNVWEDCDEDGHDHPLPGLEPWEPNVTRAVHGFFELASAAEHVKWGHLIDPSTGVPTLRNGECGDCPSGANPLATPDEIGLFEGAQYYHCDLYRPAFDCRMRNSTTHFCLVCVEAAHQVLRPHLPEGARVVAEIDSLDLGAICSGSAATASFRIANLGTVFGEVEIDTTVGNLAAEVVNFGAPPGTLVNPAGLIPGQAARVKLNLGPLDLPSTVLERLIEGEVRVMVDGTVQVTLPFRVTVHTPRPEAAIMPALLDFGDVAVGLTMYRRLRIRNTADPCPLPLDVILDQLTGPFAFTDTIANEIELDVPGFTTRDVFLRYTAPDSPGLTANGSLRLRTNDPNLPQMTVTLQARVVAPAPVDSVLVIDRSGSMDHPTGEQASRKIDHAIFAVDLYTSLLRDDDRIGLVRFNQHSTVDDGDLLVDLAPAAGSANGREQVQGVLAEGTSGPLDPAGNTSIGAGMLLGSTVLDGAVSNRRAIVVLTDGRENRGVTIEEARTAIEASVPGQRVFAVGFGLDQTTESVLSITTETGGAALVTGELVADKEFLLQKLFVQILSDQADWSMVFDPIQRLEGGETRRTRIQLGETDLFADFIVAFRPGVSFPKYLRTWLRLPNGALLNRDNLDQFPGASYTERGNHLLYRLPLTAIPGDAGAHLGAWEMWVANDTSPDGGEPLVCSVLARAYGDLRMGGRLVQRGYQAGAPMEVTLQPTLFGQTAEALEPVRARVTLPDGQRQDFSLHRARPGVYRGVFRNTGTVGPYHFDCTAVIRTPSGIPVTRTRYLGGVILPPPKGERPKPPRRELPEWKWTELERILEDFLRWRRQRD
jgi:hypothetical protein